MFLLPSSSTELHPLQLSNETTLVALGLAFFSFFSEGSKHHPDTQLLLAPGH